MKATLWLSLAALAVAGTAALAADWDWSDDAQLQRAVLMSSKDPNLATPIFVHGFYDNLYRDPNDPNGPAWYQAQRLAHLDNIDDRGFNYFATIFPYDSTNPPSMHFDGDDEFMESAEEKGVKVMVRQWWTPQACDPNGWAMQNISYCYDLDLPVFSWYLYVDADSCVDVEPNCPTNGIWDPNYPGAKDCTYFTQWMCWADRLALLECRGAAVENADPDAFAIVSAGYPGRAAELLQSCPNVDLYQVQIYEPPNLNPNQPAQRIHDTVVAGMARPVPMPVIAEPQMSVLRRAEDPNAFLAPMINEAEFLVYSALANGAAGIAHFTLSWYDDQAGLLYDFTDPNDPLTTGVLDGLEDLRVLTSEFEGALLNGTLYRVADYADPSWIDEDNFNLGPVDRALATYWLYDRSDGPDEVWVVVVNIWWGPQTLSIPLPLAFNLRLEEKDSYGASNISWVYQSSPRSYVLTGTLAQMGYYVAKFTTENDETTTNWCLGDMNCDGTISTGDINPFVAALSDPESYATNWPGCPMVNNGDANGDRKLTTADITPFVALISQNPAPTCP